MKHYLRGRYAIVEADVQTFRRQKLDSDVLKSPLLNGHVMHVLKLAVTRRVGYEGCPHAPDGAVAYEFLSYQFAVYEGVCIYLLRHRTRDLAEAQFPIGCRAQVHGLC
jgi:hypothetical protein